MVDSSRLVGLLLLPDFSQLGLAAVTEPLFVANWLSGRALYRWRTLSLDGKPARSRAAVQKRSAQRNSTGCVKS